jgi:hypothetical protein
MKYRPFSSGLRLRQTWPGRLRPCLLPVRDQTSTDPSYFSPHLKYGARLPITLSGAAPTRAVPWPQRRKAAARIRR